VIFQDVTQRRGVEMRERELQTRLARAARMESLGLMAGGVAHDLNNILSPMVAYPDLILEELPPHAPARVYVRRIREAAVRAAAIIRDLLTLARRGTFQFEAVDVNRVVRDYLDSADYSDLCAHHPGVRVEVRRGEDLPRIVASGHHVAQALVNIVRNAFEAIPEAGEVAIETAVAETGEVVTTFGAIPAGRYVRVAVSDTGVGIERGEMDHIFEPFYSRKLVGRTGTGLGLSVVYGAVQDCGGFIDVQSAAGRGTRFELMFPPANREAVEPGAAPARVEGGSESVLVVDDEPLQRELCSTLLAGLGYRVAAAASGRAAVEAAAVQAFDLVLLDMIMEPDFDGLRTFEELRKKEPRQRCLIVSGYAQTPNVQGALAQGALGFVAKPYTRSTLARAVRAALDGGSAPGDGAGDGEPRGGRHEAEQQ
jgi:CheY-like chemotaxis protein/nitrogen-specific signal transduction histidine kinase